ncbi:MAG: hypothetical protein WBF88_17515 [Pusillimonas sp.]
MSGQILTAEPGKVTRFHSDGDKFHIQTTADVEPVIERVTALHNEGHQKTGTGDHHVASIPLVVVNAWAIKRGVTFDAVMQDIALFREMVNDPELAAFRVYKGNV